MLPGAKVYRAFFLTAKSVVKDAPVLTELHFFTQVKAYVLNTVNLWDNVISIDVQTPYDIERRNLNMPEGSWAVGQMLASQMGRFRPFAEIAQYRTPIKNLYICSANMHYGGGVGRSSSYNCFKVITEDLGLEKIWEKKGRPY